MAPGLGPQKPKTTLYGLCYWQSGFPLTTIWPGEGFSLQLLAQNKSKVVSPDGKSASPLGW